MLSTRDGINAHTKGDRLTIRQSRIATLIIRVIVIFHKVISTVGYQSRTCLRFPIVFRQVTAIHQIMCVVGTTSSLAQNTRRKWAATYLVLSTLSITTGNDIVTTHGFRVFYGAKFIEEGT